MVKNGRAFCMVDESAEAIAVMEKRLAKYSPALETVAAGAEGIGSTRCGG
jgi:hypothetical protein